MSMLADGYLLTCINKPPLLEQASLFRGWLRGRGTSALGVCGLPLRLHCICIVRAPQEFVPLLRSRVNLDAALEGGKREWSEMRGIYSLGSTVESAMSAVALAHCM